MMIMLLDAGTPPLTRQPVSLMIDLPRKWANPLHLGAGWSALIACIIVAQNGRDSMPATGCGNRLGSQELNVSLALRMY